jgi:Ca2+-binding EF-hand superfamily protein
MAAFCYSVHVRSKKGFIDQTSATQFNSFIKAYCWLKKYSFTMATEGAAATSSAATRKQQQQLSKLAESLAKRSRFNLTETEGLLALYRQLLTSGGGSSQTKEQAQQMLANQDRLDRTKFREFLHNSFDMTDDILLDRVFKRFDADNDGYISREEWIMGLSIFLKGTTAYYGFPNMEEHF